VATAALACGAVAWAAGAAGASPSAHPGGYGGYGGHGGYGSAPTGSAPAAKHTPTLVGTVKSSNGTTILITDLDGFTRTINLSSSTTYDDSLTSTPTVGTKIEAQGSVDADGTSLDATVIETPELPMGGGPGHGGAPMPGGKPGARPSAAPTS
jgi:hypothetical protein